MTWSNIPLCQNSGKSEVLGPVRREEVAENSSRRKFSDGGQGYHEGWEVANKLFFINMYCTPYPSVPVRCAPVASLVDKFAEIASPVPIYAFPTNK